MDDNSNLKKPRRPVRYSREVACRVCEAIASGKTLRQIEQIEGMPRAWAIVKWASRNVDDFAERYEKAIAYRAYLMADEIIDIADDAANDYRPDEEKGLVFDKEHVQRSKLRIEARKWLLSKLLPEKFGEKLALSHKSDPININHNHQIQNLEHLTLDELARLYREEIEEASPPSSQPAPHTA